MRRGTLRASGTVFAKYLLQMRRGALRALDTVSAKYLLLVRSGTLRAWGTVFTEYLFAAAGLVSRAGSRVALRLWQGVLLQDRPGDFGVAGFV